MELSNKPVANPVVLLREEFDDWAVLFDPDTGNAFGLNPTGVFVWKCLDGSRTVGDILNTLQENCKEVPDEAEQHLNNFILNLSEQGLVGYEIQKN